MKWYKLLAAGALLAPLLFAQPARAEYCREYTKTIRVGGDVKSGYGRACMQPDGSWVIVSANGHVDPFDALRERNVTIIAQDEPVYYTYGPRFRPVTYYAPARYYYPRPGIYFSYSKGGHGHGWHDGRHKGWRRHRDHHDRHDHDRDHGDNDRRGRGRH